LAETTHEKKNACYLQASEKTVLVGLIFIHGHFPTALMAIKPDSTIVNNFINVNHVFFSGIKLILLYP